MRNAQKTRDYTLTLERVRKRETEHGQVPTGAFVAMRTDWSRRWPDAEKMANKDGQEVAHYPGLSLPALKYLYEESKITASGHETTDTDPGLATTKDDYSLESYILGTNHYQIELLTNPDQVPEFGAIVVISFPKPKGGSGSPARVFAIPALTRSLMGLRFVEIGKNGRPTTHFGGSLAKTPRHTCDRTAQLHETASSQVKGRTSATFDAGTWRLPPSELTAALRDRNPAFTP